MVNVYEYLKELDENVYENFISIRNNIFNQDKNINNMFRVTMESILQYINSRKRFVVKNKEHFVQDILNDIDFAKYIDSYKIQSLQFHIITMLKNIQQKGSNTIHNEYKIFDDKDVEEKFIFLMLWVIEVIKKEKRTDVNIGYEEVKKEYESIIREKENNNNKEVEIELDETSYDKAIEEIIVELPEEKTIKTIITDLDIEIKNLYMSNNKNILSIDIQEKLKEMLSIIMEDIKSKDNTIKRIEDFKLGPNQYKMLYKMKEFLERPKFQEEADEKNEDKRKNIIGSLESYFYDINSWMEANLESKVFEWYFVEEIENNEKTNEKETNLKLAEIIEKSINDKNVKLKEGIYYIEKQTPFFVNGKRYFKINIEFANRFSSKTGEKCAYSKERIDTTYATNLQFSIEKREFLDKTDDICIIHKSKIEIRPTEVSHMIFVLTGNKPQISKKLKFYKELMSYLNEKNCNLLDIVLFTQTNFDRFIEKFENIKSNNSKAFAYAMKQARDIIMYKKPGENVLRFLLVNLKYKILRRQCEYKKKLVQSPNNDLSNLYVTYGCGNFEKMPFCMNLVGSQIRFSDVINSIDYKEHMAEVVRRKIKECCIENNTIYVDMEELILDETISELIEDEDKRKIESFIKEMIQVYNSNVDIINYKTDQHLAKILCNKGKYLFFEDEYNRLKEIMKSLNKFSNNYNDNNINNVISSEVERFSDITEDKKSIVKKAFKDSNMLLLYGEAGSGKTEMICNYLAKIFNSMDYSMLYVTNTHSVKNSIKNRVKGTFKNNKHMVGFKTVKSLTKMIKEQKQGLLNWDVVFFDECNSISNEDMNVILNGISPKYAIFTGDIAQIQSIELGNWFRVAKELVNKNLIGELKINNRTNNNNLKTIWNKVKNREKDTITYLKDKGYIKNMDESIYCREEDEIILCLNYDGEYGINAMNSYLQNANTSKECLIGINKYKVNDYIVFNDTVHHIYENNTSVDRVLYNNLKGVIKDIQEDDEHIVFTLEVEEFIEKEDIIKLGSSKIQFKRNFVDEFGKNISRIIMTIDKHNIDEESNEKYVFDEKDENDEACIVPFEVSYAMSIHKAQGLQYNSVKIVITPESISKINNAVFYTAITRAKEKLQIYITEPKQIDKLDIISYKETKDVEFLKEAFENEVFGYSKDDLPF